MKKFFKHKNRVLLTALSVAILGVYTTASADEGVARIADSNYTGEPQLLSFEGASVEYGGYVEGGYVEGGCPNCYSGACEGGCEKDGWCNKYPADAGWGRPIRNYIQHTPVSYLKRWPDSVHGINHPGPMQRFPMVYQPTDTTQLGFTYQRVPTWHAKPWMLPPVPVPSQWHQREYGYRRPVGYGSGYGYGSQYGSGAPCYQGEVIYTDATYEGTVTPSEAPANSPSIKSNPTEVPPEPQVRQTTPDLLRSVSY
ncbi:hypothetical protein Pla110_26860 [Polystyrenella longa]|uniref:Secreted protein n=1 Tax=Polystyrenella longa TaxID=2528007 RepID=A0A518CNZ5_9PLAN|nr:hypothetical protein [Polystyrenella longa]QDU80950.1 hypothetical protein Pla110_26860 [Polystyrenella longa]